MKMLNFESKFGYDVADIVDSSENVIGDCVISLWNRVSMYINGKNINLGKHETYDEAVKVAENWLKENLKDNYYPIIDKKVMIPFMDATDIRYILESLVQYIEEVGPRDLRGLEERAKEYIAALPEYDPFEDDEE